MSLNCVLKSDPMSEVRSLLPDGYWLSRFNSYQQHWRMTTWMDEVMEAMERETKVPPNLGGEPN